MQTSLIRLSAMIAHQFGVERAPTQLIEISGGGISLAFLISKLISLTEVCKPLKYYNHVIYMSGNDYFVH